MSNEIRIVDPKTGGAKGQKDERFDLMPFEALEELARVYGIGARKYDDDNWRRGYRYRLSAGALMRHVSRWMQREDRDPETGCHHLAHAAWHCLTLITFQMLGLGTDDRARHATPPPASVDTSAPTEAAELSPDEPIPFVVVPLPPLVPADLDVPITHDPDFEPFPYREDGSEGEDAALDLEHTLSGIGASVSIDAAAEALERGSP